jgi:PEP-CTERM motif-containing protein
MKFWTRGLLAAVLVQSTVLLASSISDPGIKLGPGGAYTTEADIVSLSNGNFGLLYNGQPTVFSNPFTDPFCTPITGGVQCNFDNQSTEPLSSLTLGLVSPFAPGELTCFNSISAEEPGVYCSVGGTNNNIVGFTAFFVPNPSSETWTVEGDYVDTGFFLQFLPPNFNPASPGGFTQDIASIQSFFVNGRPVPEPASLALMLSGLFGLGWARKRKAHAENL